MITGGIRNREAVIELEVFGPDNLSERVECVIDTGFNGYLTLPSNLIKALHLQFGGHRLGMLADGTLTRLEAYLASVDWHGRRRDVLISQGAGIALVGMSLLEGGRLILDVVDGGDVTIEELQ